MVIAAMKLKDAYSLEENIGIVLDDFGVGDHFLNSDTKTTNYKRRNKLNFFRINNSVF